MKTKKRLFIGLLSVSLGMIIGLVILIWFLAVNRDVVFYRVLLVVFGIFLLGIVALVGVGIVGMVLTLYQAKAIPSMQSYMRMATNLLFPMALGIGHLLGMNKNQIKSSFIEVNNQMVHTKKLWLEPEQVMILAPHCLQKSSCPHKLTMDVQNCKRCGGCSVHRLLELSEKYGVPLVVAPGGTLARRFIEKYRPQAIVAIACERDLTSGILDVNPLPVLGVRNMRPEGPCVNTTVDLNQVENAIQFFLVNSESWQKIKMYREVEG
ncbi:DUF116 domain-containing protein [Candidatus Formimonas warabiya]|uniref:DUF116 domain-containing protein n=1 Tax=Formimonas warabiya TaxID=1761012 RepID=A0A3G1KQH2_FORW1|nr:DUF116 domain-containing protein [Candidatus Formimonas warabiya]ATW24696.1 hypothetical protein DCMF_07825 [Candidatus Formimonas warabiya]